MSGVQKYVTACIAVLLTVAIAIPMTGQQQTSRKAENPFENNKKDDLVTKFGVLETGVRTGNLAEHKGSVDHYYFDAPESEWIPDEFMSNPDTKIDIKSVKGYHLPPRIKDVKIVDKKAVYKPGDTVKFECVVFNKSKVNAFQLNYHGPQGRRTESYAQFRTPKETWKEGDMLYQRFEGTLQLSKWAEAGTYLALAIQNLNNELGHGKSYRSDYLPGMDRAALAFTVEDNPNQDTTPPVLKKLVLGSLDGTPPAQPFAAKITDLIPIYVEAEDDLSGVDDILVTIASPTKRYSDLSLQPLLDKPNAFVGYFRLNRWYEGGEYWISRMEVRDAAGNYRYPFPQSHPAMTPHNKVMIQPDRPDSTPPRLVTLTVDKENAKAGDQVKFTAIVADDNAGTGEVIVTIHSPSAIDKRRVTLRPKAKPSVMIKPAYDVQENLVEGSFTIFPEDEPGVWTVKRVVARDLANNYLDMVSTAYPKLETVQVTFADPVATKAPTSTAAPAAAAPAAVAPAAGGAQKIRRVDMIPPHPPRGACLNCHEP